LPNPRTAEDPSDRAGDAAGSADVLAAIRDAIIAGEFVPNQRLVEADLSQRFSASRGGVRLALLALAGEGLVERVQHRGARVRAVSLEEAVEITEVRMAVESLCAAKAAQRADASQRRELRALSRAMATAVAGGEVVRYSQLNHELHRRVREIGAQHTAAGVLERLRGQSVRHQFRLAMQPGRPAASLPEHQAIIEAICSRDPEAAERAMRAHLGSVIDALRTAQPVPPGLEVS
jgi:DNA-binding GntR family transcriptional regulator